ncbi:ABC transporter substrate-binding protein [Rhodococcus sp. X156]|uniref:ABC transporter substrate-binding protein n=1 Tax=Rhodococcus sp. X156 TaxID=2499145 RepID=UPI001F49786A|nr:ABC transporter substrate-binding protein [Rhodococcus sp. X156]
MAVSLAATLLAAGCGAGEETSATAPAADAQVDPNAVLKVAASAPTRNLDPYLQTSYGGWGYISAVYDRLVLVDDKDKLVPGVATSWEFAKDGSSLELKLRDDVKFHDGTPFDAAAVAANIKRGQTLKGSTVVAALKDVTSVDVVNPTTARLNLAKGTGVDLPGLFSTNVGMMISPKVIEAGTDIQNQPGNAGSGPYLVSSYTPGEKLSLKKAPGTYWDPKAGRLGGIELQWTADASTRLNGTRTGATDLTWVSSANELVQAKDLAKQGGLVVNTVEFRNVLSVMLRARGDLAKPEIREAVARAVNPQAISALFSDTCSPYRQLEPSSSWATDQGYQYPYAYDEAKAKELVAANGPAKIALTFGAGTNTEQPANVIQSELSKVGFNAELNPVPNTVNEPRYIAGDFEAMVTNSYSPKVDPAETVKTFVTGAYKMGNDNPEILKLAAEASDPTKSQDERGALYKKIWSLTLDEALVIPICHQTNATVASPKVIGADNMPWVNTGIFDLRYVAMTS